MKHFHIVALGAIALSTSAGAAHADPVIEKVGYGDLNLGSVAGRSALRHRIAAAADRVCDSSQGTFDLAARQVDARCRKVQTARALALATAAAERQPALAAR